MSKTLNYDEIEIFMEGVAARLGNAKPPSYDDLGPYEAWSAAVFSVQDAISDEIESRQLQRAMRSRTPSGV